MTAYDPTAGSPGMTGQVLLPQVQAAYARDPRTALVSALLAQGREQLNQPTYNGKAALAKALTIGLGGLQSGMLQREYMNANEGAMDAYRGAARMGAPPTPGGSSGPAPGLLDRVGSTVSGGVSDLGRWLTGTASPPSAAPSPGPMASAAPQPPQASDGGARSAPSLSSAASSPSPSGAALPPTDAERSLMSNNVTMLQGFGMWQARNQAELARRAKVSEAAQNKGLNITGWDPNGNPIVGANTDYQAGVASGAGQTKTAEANAQNTSDLQFKPQIAGATAAAENPALIARAGGVRTAENASDLTYKPKIAGATAAAENPALIARAGGVRTAENASDLTYKPKIARATAEAEVPAKVAVSQLSPVVDRVTGEVVIPGLDPKINAQVNDYLRNQGILPGGGAGTAPAAAAASPSPSAQSSPVPAAPAPSGKLPEDVPTIALPTGLLPKGEGTIIPGRDPITMKAGEGAVEQATGQYKEIAESAKAANANHAMLGTMRTTLTSGGVNTNATAPARATLSAYLNAVIGPEVAKSVTGIDPAQADVFNKDATRMGLTFARQTEGAREAVAAIKIALGANPGMSNTLEGNKMIVDILDAGTQHDMDAQRLGDKFFQKNGHYVGYPGWFNETHPAAAYTSRVMPYSLPTGPSGVDTSQLQPGVTYKTAKGAGVFTGTGFVAPSQ